MTVSSVRASAPDPELAAAFAVLRAELELSEGFPTEVDAEAVAAIAEFVPPVDDATGIPFITLDPAGSTDLDQALHLERAGAGYRVFYAIADVPAFVRPGGAIDAEARRRGQTMYAPDGRIPLHPVAISEGAASLLPGEPRGAFVWTFELDAAASVTTASVRPARVTSRRQWAYPDVQEALDAGTADPVFALLREVGQKRIALERQRGGASLNRPDQEIVREGEGYRLVRRKALPVEGWNAQISLMTGMAAAQIMLDGEVGILRTLPAPDRDAIDRFRTQTVALGTPWSDGMEYGEYLRSLDSDDPRQLAIVAAAGSLFRGAGYCAFDGEIPADPLQSAVGAPYAHVTAPLRRLVDRFALVVCASLTAGQPVPGWVREALPGLPSAMGRSDSTASRLERGSIDAVEAALLRDRVGRRFDATVISLRKTGASIQLSDPAVTADCEGELTPGERVEVTLVEADVATGSVLFRAD